MYRVLKEYKTMVRRVAISIRKTYSIMFSFSNDCNTNKGAVNATRLKGPLQRKSILLLQKNHFLFKGLFIVFVKNA